MVVVAVLEVVDDVDDGDGDVVLEVFEGCGAVVGAAARLAVGLSETGDAVGRGLVVVDGLSTGSSAALACSASPAGASEAVRVACAPRTAGAGGTTRPRLGNPNVGRWTGPTRGSRAKPRATSPR